MDGGGSSMTGQITKLNSFNFKSWKFEIEMVLRERGVWEIVNGTEEFCEKSASVEILQKYRLRVSRAYSTLALSLGDDVRSLIEGAVTPFEIWKLLKEAYEPISRSRIATLRREFYLLSYQPGETMHAFIGRVMQVRNQLENAGKKIPDDELAYQLIGSLPEQYESLVLQIYQFDDDKFKSEAIKKLLIAEYGRQIQKQQDENGREREAFATSQGEPQQKISDKRDMIQRPKNNPQNNNRRFNGRCFTCKRLGHRSADCYVRRRFDFKSRKIDETKNSNESAFYAMAMFSSVSEDFNDWYIDTAATDHFCNRREWFSSYKPLENHEIAVGEGESIAKGIGEISIEVDCNGMINKFRLMNVVHTPRMRRNLIAARRIDEAGFKGTFGDGKLRVYYPNKRLAFEAPLRNNFYTLKAKVVQKRDANIIEANLSAVASDYMTQLELWHHRLGHINESDLKYLSNHNYVRGLPQLKGELNTCVSCKLSKSIRTPHKRLGLIRSKQPLELVHLDLWGPAPVESLGGARYCLVLVDDFSRNIVVYTISRKNQVFDCFKQYRARVEKETGRNIQILRTDNGMEFCSDNFSKYCIKVGIKHEKTNVYSPAMNGVAERVNLTLMNTVRVLLEDAKLPPSLWAELVRTAAYLKNRIKHSSVDDGVPLTRWIGRRPNINHLKRIGCTAFVHIHKTYRNKFQRRARLGVLVGYAVHTKGYRIWYPYEKKVVETNHVSFDEKKLGVVQIGYRTGDQTFYTNWEMESNNEFGETVVLQQNLRIELQDVGKDVSQPKLPQGWSRDVIIRKSGMTKGQADIYYVNPEGKRLRSMVEVTEYKRHHDPTLNLELFDYSRDNVTIIPVQEYEEACDIFHGEANCAEFVIPKNYIEAMNSPQYQQWLEAMKVEMKMFENRDVAEIVEKPNDKRIVGSRWVYTVKKDSTGKIAKYKARLVAQGFSQIEGVDYDETFSPVVNFTIFRLFIALFVVMFNWELHHFDVAGAYLYGRLEQETYMRQPPGFEEKDPNKFCLKLKKALYGLHQSGRKWFEELDQTFINLGFEKFIGINCVYYQPNDVIVLVYVDDLAVFAKNKEIMFNVFKLISSKFDIKDLGPIKKFLGVEIEQRQTGDIKLHQKSYIQEIASRFQIKCEGPVSLPLSVGILLSRRDCPETEEQKKEMNMIPYRSLIGCLLFVAQHTRPDILYAVIALSQFSSNPGYIHWNRLCQILRYILSTIDLGLIYKKETCAQITAFSDSDWGGDRDTRRSDCGYIFFFGSSPFAWRAFKQKSVSLSTMEAEYIALSETVRELLWLIPILEECVRFNISLTKPIIHCDNQSAIMFSNNCIENVRSKHIDIRYHFVREKYQEDLFGLKFVNSKENVADIFTKILPKETFQKFVKKLTLI